MMESIKMRQRVGQDGRLHLDIPVGLTDQDVDVMVIYQPVSPVKVATSALEDLYGICADAPISLDDSGISDSLDEGLVGAFD